MSRSCVIIAALLMNCATLTGLLFIVPSPTHAADPESCAPAGGLSFICGVRSPEDLVPLPGSRYIIASGMVEGSGLHLVDTAAKTARSWTAKPPSAASPIYHDCAAPPAPDKFVAHGLNIRQQDQGRETLYVVNHRGRETIEVFDIDSHNAEPDLTWVGCIAMPAGLSANSVASAPDGAIFATVLIHPGTSFADLIAQRPTGAVYVWRPGSSGFQRVWGTELAGDNGVEVSPDGRTIYVAATGQSAVAIFSNSNPANLVRMVSTPAFNPDNVHWVDGRLLVAGMNLDEPACGGRIQVENRVANFTCPRGYVIAAIDPVTTAITTVASGPATPGYTGVATGLVVGKTLWLGSFTADKLAYRTLP
jgi:hypothetical protein